MSDQQEIKDFLSKAEVREKEYDWLGAVEFYEKALDHVLKQKDFSKAGSEDLGKITFIKDVMMRT